MDPTNETPSAKKRRLSPSVALSPITPSQVASTSSHPTKPPTILLQESPSVIQPDEEISAPPSSASGAHAKPLSALFSGNAGSGSSSSASKKGKGKGKEDDKEGFESVLARLQEGGELLSLFLAML